MRRPDVFEPSPWTRTGEMRNIKKRDEKDLERDMRKMRNEKEET